ncbi:MAG TPA: MFS transporter [Tepidisphaeraceae bacterium]|jgi:OPA family glycerol-3-phosphate transporter-like MFS transporter/OPA family sugar phosphate sensor protein UhpC-like MFS transporter|nr:MFS transporter [Tepidisphaeraceae bacterium]
MAVLEHFRTQADLSERITDPGEIDRKYRYWRVRILATTIVGYALFYFVKTNIYVPLKAMEHDLGYSKEQLGLIATIGGVTYGISKFINGFLGDHANPRYFMAIGLLGCALMNVFFGMSSSILFFCTFWFANNYFQGMGFPPCAKSMGYWFSPRERGTTFGIWHTSHMIGGALIAALTGYLVKYLGWRSCFYIPAGFAVLGAIIVVIFLRDTPGSMGLPPVEIYKGEETEEELARELKEREGGPEGAPLSGEEATYWEVVWEYIFKNPYMWVISFANLSVYVLRYAQVTWGPTFLQEAKGLSVVSAGWLSFGSEMGGMLGALIGGYVADRYFKGRAGRVCCIAMVLMAGTIYAFQHSPRSSPVLTGALFVMMGFLLYVPQMLIAAMAMNLGTKRASAAAVGLTGIIGYMSTIITGWGIGSLVDRHGWPAAFELMLGCAVITLVLMAITWNVGAHPELE